MPALVSVILPTYNRAAYLAESIDSVLAQTHAELEAIVVDDGSTDHTRELVLERCRADPRVRYHPQENAGVAAARNAGLRLARGDFVAFIDSDDAWKPWKLELQLRCLEHEPQAGMLWTDMEAIGPGGEAIAPAFLTTYYHAYRHFGRDALFSRSVELSELGGPHGADPGRRLYVGDVFSPMIMGNLVHTPTAIVRRERLERVGFFDESFRGGGEDFHFWLRTCREGLVAYADVSSIRYRIGMDDNVSNPANAVTYAESYLATIEPVLQRDRARIALSPAMVATARAYGQLWLGRALLTSGSPARARVHLRRALRLRPWQPEAMILAIVSHAPPALAVYFAGALRRSARWGRSRAARDGARG